MDVCLTTVLFTFFVIICDPPQDFEENGDDRDTRAMIQHAFRVTMSWICAYLISKTDCHSRFCLTHLSLCFRQCAMSRPVLYDTARVSSGTRAS